MAQNEQNAGQQGRRRGWRTMHWDDGLITNNPDRTPDLLENTSLGSPYVPPVEPSPLQRRRAQQLQQLQERLARAVREREQRAEQKRNAAQQARHWGRIADMRGDMLRAHVNAFPSLQREYNTILIRFATEAMTDPAKQTTLAEFCNHLRRAREATNAPVREYCIVSWFTVGLPEDLVDIIGQISEHHLRTARTRWSLHQAELRAAGITRHRDCPVDYLCSEIPHEIWARGKTSPPFGWSFEDEVNGFTSYPYEVSAAADLQHLRANFETRKVRLEHAEVEMRWGFGIDWPSSLDYHMQMFLSEGIACIDPYFTDAGSLVTKMRTHRGEIDARRNIILDAEKVLDDGVESAQTSDGTFTRDRAKEIVDEAGIWQQAIGEGVKRAPSTYSLGTEWAQLVKDCKRFLNHRSNTSFDGLPARFSSGLARRTPTATAPPSVSQIRQFVPLLPRAHQDNTQPASDEEEAVDSMEE